MAFLKSFACWDTGHKSNGRMRVRSVKMRRERADLLLLLAEETEALLLVLLLVFVSFPGTGLAGHADGGRECVSAAGRRCALVTRRRLRFLRGRRAAAGVLDGLNPCVHLLIIFGLEEILISISNSELEDVFLLLIVDRNLTHGLLQADGDLVVVWDALTCVLIVLVEAHLMVIDHAVHIMPGSAGSLLVVSLPLMFAVQESLQLS